MKASRRYIRLTLAAVLIAPALVVLASRITGSGTSSPAPQRTSAVQLSQLRDFDSIDARGDFRLEIVSGPEYEIVYEPLWEDRGDFRAEVQNGELVLRGYRNRNEYEFARVRVSMPALRAVETHEIQMLTVSDFATQELDLRTFGASAVTLASNRIGTLRAELRGSETLDLADNRIANGELRVAGTVRVTTEE